MNNEIVRSIGGNHLVDSKKESNESAKNLAIWIAGLLDKKGGLNIKVLETKPGTYISDFLVVATGTSSRHMQSLLDAPCAELKKLGYPPLHIEGEGSHWMLADCGDVVIHIFDEQTRGFYDIEGLWDNAPRIEWDPQRKRLRKSV